MSVHKVIEILAQSDKGWEDAARNAVSEASETVSNIKSIYIKDMQGIVKDGEIAEYRVNAKITFGVRDVRE
ncbi:MAG: dodecin family protein [Gemmatimonadota bacterium]|nr:dodecin family protein [Gemmatimonadota bacterium]